jgi:hypothetical protein
MPQRSPLLPKVLSIFSKSDRQPQAEAKNAFKKLKVGKLRAYVFTWVVTME